MAAAQRSQVDLEGRNGDGVEVEDKRTGISKRGYQLLFGGICVCVDYCPQLTISQTNPWDPLPLPPEASDLPLGQKNTVPSGFIACNILSTVMSIKAPERFLSAS
ncbi:hypothetical protein IWW34DRAFT_641915 [Fusarium oxysporum f. sp. albedinis]|nr:hypothetical protein IWW34DRAFT_641915 [Fusarium oxysporum f. sp. albedinis]